MCEINEFLCGCSLRAGSISVLLLDGILFLVTALFSCLAIAFVYAEEQSATQSQTKNAGFLVAIGLAKMALLLVKTIAGTLAWCSKFKQPCRALHLGTHASIDILEFLLLLPFYVFYALWLQVRVDALIFLLWHFLFFVFLQCGVLIYLDLVLFNFYKEGVDENDKEHDEQGIQDRRIIEIDPVLSDPQEFKRHNKMDEHTKCIEERRDRLSLNSIEESPTTERMGQSGGGGTQNMIKSRRYSEQYSGRTPRRKELDYNESLRE